MGVAIPSRESKYSTEFGNCKISKKRVGNGALKYNTRWYRLQKALVSFDLIGINKGFF